MIRRIFDTLAIVLFVALWPVLAMAQVTKITPASGGSSGITIDSTTISGGATTQVLYNAAGVVSSDSGFTRGSGTTTISNGAAAVSPLIVYDNVTPVFTIADGGNISVGAGNLTMPIGSVITGMGGINIPDTGYVGDNTGVLGALSRQGTLTPDAMYLYVGTTPNSMHFGEFADRTYDFNNGACGTSACTDPGFIIHSAVQDTTQYNHLSAWGQAGGALKTLTAGAATALVRIPVATNSRASGELVYEIYATDGTDMQVRSSRIRYAMTNKAGTEACTLTASDGAAANAETNDDNAASITAGTLTYGIACTNNAADTMDITFNAVSSLVETTLSAKWSVVHLSPGQPARQ